MAVIIPSQVSYGTITGQFIFAVADGPDADTLPDAKAAVGTVIFTPSVNKIVAGGKIVLPKPISVVLDADGYFSVKLIATNDPDTNPTNFTYNVSFIVPDSSLTSFNIPVPADTTTDLATLVPLT